MRAYIEVLRYVTLEAVDDSCRIVEKRAHVRWSDVRASAIEWNTVPFDKLILSSMVIVILRRGCL